MVFGEPFQDSDEFPEHGLAFGLQELTGRDEARNFACTIRIVRNQVRPYP
jgi:hypothetical protein